MRSHHVSLRRFLLCHTLTTATVLALTVGCLRAAVTLTLTPATGTPSDAKVTIDEQFVGLLGFVAARGVRLPEGEHRVTVEREGYFPYDQIVVSDRETLRLNVQLQRLPD